MGALDGLLVVSLEQAVAAPFVSSRLADAGARIIKIERPEGDFARNYDDVVKGHSAYFVWLNRGKESITMDLRMPSEIRLLESMLDKADVLIENLKTGSLQKIGLDLLEIRKVNPKLITCSISGYGRQGDWSAMKAYDLLIQAETAIASITGSRDAPGRVGVSIADIAAGMYSHAAILEALIARGISGRGRHIEVSLFDAIAEWMAVPLMWNDYGGEAPKRLGLAHPSICPYGAFKTSDGKVILLSVQNEREWKNFCTDILEDSNYFSKFPDNTSRVKNRKEVDDLVHELIGRIPHAEAAARMKKAEIAFATLNEVQDFSKHPVLRRAKITIADDEIKIPSPPAIFNNKPTEILGSVPGLNQHGREIRAEFAKTES